MRPSGASGRHGVRKLGEDVSVLSRLQLSEEALIRLGQRPSKAPARAELPDVVFYSGCNVLKTPHIALLCLDIMDMIGTDYQVMGGPTHCCGTGQLRAGDTDTLARFAANTINKLSQSKTGQVIAGSSAFAVRRYRAADLERRPQMPFDRRRSCPSARANRFTAARFEKRRDDGGLHRIGNRGVMEGPRSCCGGAGIALVKLECGRSCRAQPAKLRIQAESS